VSFGELIRELGFVGDINIIVSEFLQKKAGKKPKKSKKLKKIVQIKKIKTQKFDRRLVLSGRDLMVECNIIRFERADRNGY
jgi:hypothetical protein